MTEIEHDTYAMVWTLTPESALEFFGAPKTAEVVVLKDGPKSPREIERYRPEAKLYGVRWWK